VEAIADRFDAAACSNYGDADTDGDADSAGEAPGSSSGTILKSDNGIVAEPARPLMGGDLATAGIAIGVGMREGLAVSVGDDVGVGYGVAASGLIVGVGAAVGITVGVAIGAGRSVGVDADGRVTVGAGGSACAAVGIGVNVCAGDDGGDAGEITGAGAEPWWVEVGGVSDADAGDNIAPAVGVGDAVGAGWAGVGVAAIADGFAPGVGEGASAGPICSSRIGTKVSGGSSSSLSSADADAGGEPAGVICSTSGTGVFGNDGGGLAATSFAARSFATRSARPLA
jgi:hypothetical protein